jgi:NAD(P)-dependent dehydrogenase (short-subunit alcohol dehydrogenase family)
MKVIVMTGISSGIGKVAAKRLAGRGCRVIGGACDLVSMKAARPLDLNNFDAIHAFAATLDTTQIGSLVLNAGVQSYDVSARTEQGFERTFGINHLAHSARTAPAAADKGWRNRQRYA